MEPKITKTGLFFGSFNPIHIGHLIIANYLATKTDLQEIWFVVSPQNPLKRNHVLAADHQRLEMVRLAINSNTRFKCSDVEFGLPRPSYTVTTLQYLRDQYPDHEFVLIMGGDNLLIFNKWKGYETILKNHKIYVYARPDYVPGPIAGHPMIRLFTELQIDLSATYIRTCVREGKSIQYLTPDPVREYIKVSKLYIDI